VRPALSDRRHRHHAAPLPFFFCLLAAALTLAGCSAEHYRKSADREAYTIIGEKTAAVPGMHPDFTIERTGETLTAEGLVALARKGKLPPLSLREAILIAAANNRGFQDRREDVYNEALDLSSARHDFATTLTGVLAGMFAKDNERTLEADTGFGVTKTLATGAEVGLSLTSDFIHFLSGDPREGAESVLQFSLTQPLWRGAGRLAATEGLVQAERDMIYELRSFVQYRRQFFVCMASDYFQVLREKNVVENERVNLENLTAARKRAKMLAEAGRLPGFQLDQAEQDELNARDSWVQSVRTYTNTLDRFKITLGLPPQTPLDLDYGELTRLLGGPVREVGGTREQAAGAALTQRLDLVTAIDQVGDAQRGVEIAKNNLAPDIDLNFNAGIGTQQPAQFTKFSSEEDFYNIGIELDLPLDRLDERNDYRSALIEFDRSRRAAALRRDEIVQEIFEDWRKLEEARDRHTIQRRSVQLAERRVESTSLLIDAGRAEISDFLDAQESLVRARNTLARTMVDYHIAVLELWRDMEVLAFEEGTFTEEKPDDIEPDKP